MSHSARTILATALALAERGERAMLCLLVRSRGSTPQSAGALMLVDERAELGGTIGGGCVEAEVRREAHRLISAGHGEVLTYRLDHDYGWDDGLICGGTVEIAVATPPPIEKLRELLADIEARRASSLRLVVESAESPAREFELALPAPERLLIAGAGHVGQALARLAMGLYFDVSLLDDRADLLERFAPAGANTRCGDIAETLRGEQLDEHTYVVIVTRGHRHDEQALEAAIDRGARYVGMIGSRRKVKLIFDDLRERGVRAEALESVHAPIGLPIGAVTVEEIALSIASQLVETRRSAGQSLVQECAIACAAQSGIRA